MKQGMEASGFALNPRMVEILAAQVECNDLTVSRQRADSACDRRDALVAQLGEADLTALYVAAANVATLCFERLTSEENRHLAQARRANA